MELLFRFPSQLGLPVAGRAAARHYDRDQTLFYRRRFCPDDGGPSHYPFDYRFVDQKYARNFQDAQRTKTMAGLFAALAVFVLAGILAVTIALATVSFQAVRAATANPVNSLRSEW